ncbi:hypothetical protein CK501_05770 [Halovibrio salipaludis]|uniref:Uncharacterized protein n=1 Tax=Halovibrio salipaludis TaxID=2032626 RepID=A0A2A2F8W2_9GAMM|nr:hypothetical protein [Halovibrio salipaludis]PAU81069.1 hypothetical protein CK501_05770 [Halovibrio salipaludis]
MKGHGFDYDTQRMRREFARLLEANPEAFKTCVEEYQRRGDEAFPPPERTGGSPKTPEQMLVLLLADYRSRQKGETRAAWIARKAEEGIPAKTRFDSKNWQTYDAIEAAIKTAEKRYKQDADFAHDVDFYQWALRVLED